MAQFMQARWKKEGRDYTERAFALFLSQNLQAVGSSSSIVFNGATRMTLFEIKNLVQKRHFCCHGGTLTLKHRSLIKRGRQRDNEPAKLEATKLKEAAKEVEKQKKTQKNNLWVKRFFQKKLTWWGMSYKGMTWFPRVATF
ncbi:hypothetical protein I3760_03G029000 [Carya illinoinensis]|nr:hypothetical protein I3760_03G029000 [Carya illinoinensis]